LENGGGEKGKNAERQREMHGRRVRMCKEYGGRTGENPIMTSGKSWGVLMFVKGKKGWIKKEEKKNARGKSSGKRITMLRDLPYGLPKGGKP